MCLFIFLIFNMFNFISFNFIQLEVKIIYIQHVIVLQFLKDLMKSKVHLPASRSGMLSPASAAASSSLARALAFKTLTEFLIDLYNV